MAKEIRFSQFIKTRGLLTKELWLNEHGVLQKDASNCRMAKGHAKLRQGEFEKFPAYLCQIPYKTAIAHGVPTPTSRVYGRKEFTVVSKKRESSKGKGKVMARTKDNFEYSTDCNALTMIDYDYEEGNEYIPPHDLIRIIGEVFPHFKPAAKIIQYSASSFIYEGDKNLTGDHPSYHIYLAVKDGQDIPRFFSNLYKLSWLSGYGFIKVSRAGSLLERSQLLDISVASPERLDFIAPARCYGKLSQHRPDPEYIEGDALDTQLLPDLSREQRDECRALISEAKRAIQPEAKSKREQYVDDEAEKLVEDSKAKGSPIAKADAKETVRNRIGGELTRNDILAFDNGDEVTVGEVLKEPEKFDRQTLCDPLEPEKGRNKAKFYANQGKSKAATVHSFARGGQNFTLSSKKGLNEVRAELEDLVQATDGKPSTEQWCQILVDAELDKAKTDEMLRFLVSKDIGGKRELNNEYKNFKHEKEVKSMEHKIEDKAASRVRIVKDDSNLNQMVDQTEKAMIERGGRWPYFNYGGALSYAEYEDFKPKFKGGTPMKPVIKQYEKNSLALRIDQSVVFTKEDAYGMPRQCKVPDEVTKSLLENPTPKAPKVTGLLPHPTILPDGIIVNEEGIDEKSDLMLMLGGKDFSSMPEDVSQDQARAAFQFLSDTLFKEFHFQDTVEDGEYKLYQVAVVSMLLTGVIRKVIDISPAFLVSANVQGTGKTTVARICNLTLTGCEMPVSTYGGSTEEANKRMLSTLIQSPTLVCFDNILDGSEIRDEVLSRVLTSPMFSDRVLGASKNVTVPTNTVFIMTGNNLTVCSDLLRRVIPISLTSDVERPEKRVFQTRDLARHCEENRVEAINACLAIIKGYIEQAPKEEFQAFQGSGYAEWDHMVRFPLWWVTGIDILKCIDIGRQDSTEEQAVRGLLHSLYDNFGSNLFTARELFNKIDFLNSDNREIYHVCDPWEAVADHLSVLAEKSTRSYRSLAWVLKRYRERLVDGLILRYAVDSSGNNGQYYIQT